MAQSQLIGNRIRDRRLSLGLKQSELARQVGISPSYLNLIEHNRRRIGGKTLLALAEYLQVEPALLSEGAEAALTEGLRVAAHSQNSHVAELDRTEEFAGRFPGWAQVLAALHLKAEALEQTTKTLTDRLANDPHLSASLHDVISSVTAIRATSSILVETKNLEPEWRARFHRNINEDSRRLAEGAEALVKYLEGAPDTDADIRSPLDEMHAFLDAHDYMLPVLEKSNGAAAVPHLVAQAPELKTDSARQMAQRVLLQAHEDAQALPMRALCQAVDEVGIQPDGLAQRLNVTLPLLFRRMTALPTTIYGPVGLVICDASGTIVFRKPIPGFAIPHAAGPCALWPLFQTLQAPMQTFVTPLEQAGRQPEPVMSYAAAQVTAPMSFDTPAQIKGYMLLVPRRQGQHAAPPQVVGTSCRICPVAQCTARREASLLTMAV
ncbi:MAG: helix-turn-helix domain-containing protein [Roseovarius sp.]|nr:helix-turn-helix domain-containing protein [Roseovarius sp.]